MALADSPVERCIVTAAVTAVEITATTAVKVTVVEFSIARAVEINGGGYHGGVEDSGGALNFNLVRGDSSWGRRRCSTT